MTEMLGFPPYRNTSKHHDSVTLWLVKWLLFRLMFASGVVKLTYMDTTWWDLSALNWHYESQVGTNEQTNVINHRIQTVCHWFTLKLSHRTTAIIPKMATFDATLSNFCRYGNVTRHGLQFVWQQNWAWTLCVYDVIVYLKGWQRHVLYYFQCIPTPVAWYFQKLPTWFHRLSVVLT